MRGQGGFFDIDDRLETSKNVVFLSGARVEVCVILAANAGLWSARCEPDGVCDVRLG
jgi:hypothetical protein